MEIWIGSLIFLLAVFAWQYLAWHGFGRWLLGLAEVNEPPRRWQRWWTALWWVQLVFIAVGTVSELYPDGPPEGGFAPWYWVAVMVGVPLGLALFGFSWMFAFRECKRRWKGRSE